MQASSAPPNPVAPNADDHRSRLIEGMALALADKGYAETTIADVVRHSRVSKRTFYEHFPDKETCFLAAYEVLSQMLLQRIAEAVAGAGDDQRAVESAVRAYFEALQELADIIGPFFTDIHAVGPAALKLRREVHQRFADVMREFAQARVDAQHNRAPLSEGMAAAMVGAVNELVLLSIEQGRTHHITEHCDTATTLLLGVLTGAPMPTALMTDTK